MKALLIALVLLACSSALLISPAAAAPLELTSVQSLTSAPAPGGSSGTYDPYLGQGDILTKAVPVCCCSFGFCEEVPDGTICFNNNSHCRCRAWSCVLVP
jgi:hypothetical protein